MQPPQQQPCNCLERKNSNKQTQNNQTKKGQLKTPSATMWKAKFLPSDVLAVRTVKRGEKRGPGLPPAILLCTSSIFAWLESHHCSLQGTFVVGCTCMGMLMSCWCPFLRGFVRVWGVCLCLCLPCRVSLVSSERTWFHTAKQQIHGSKAPRWHLKGTCRWTGARVSQMEMYYRAGLYLSGSL